MKLSRRYKSFGLTLVELLIVIAIIGILAGIAIPLYVGNAEDARVQSAIADIGSISLVIDEYRTDRDSLPTSLADINYATYLDPWGNPYQYLNIQTAKNKGQMKKDHFMVPLNTDYDLYSMGKDGKSKPPLTAQESRDDVIRANNGGYILKI
jgi:general secretion pathway protein G